MLGVRYNAIIIEQRVPNKTQKEKKVLSLIAGQQYDTLFIEYLVHPKKQ